SNGGTCAAWPTFFPSLPNNSGWPIRGDAPQLTQTIFRNKGVVLDSLIEDHLLAEASSDHESRALIEQLGPAKQRLTQLLMEPPKDLSEQGLKRRADERQRLSGEVERLEGKLGRNVAGLGHARRALSVTVAQVQAALPGRTALVELLRYHHYLGKQKWEQRYGAAIVTSAVEPKWVCLESAAPIDANILL